MYQRSSKEPGTSQTNSALSGNRERDQKDRSRRGLVDIVRHLARGNVSLQYGWLQTEEDLDDLRKELADYDFRVHTDCEHRG